LRDAGQLVYSAGFAIPGIPRAHYALLPGEILKSLIHSRCAR